MAKKSTPGKVGRPPKYDTETKSTLTLGLSVDARKRLERLQLVMSAQVNRKLTIAEAALLALEESPSYQNAMKGFIA
jgi:hypothetical protein